MTRNRMDRRRKTKLVFGVLAVGIVMSALVAALIVYLGQMYPRH
jgi:hypothetical protein